MSDTTGGCYCGAVRFSFDAPPIVTRMCWCRDCQYLSSGNASVNAIFATSGFTCHGDITDYVSTADSGTEMHRAFCPRCGTPLFSRAASRPDVMVVRVGALDDPGAAGPSTVIWTASAPCWASIDPALEAIEGQPAPVRAS